MRYIIILIGCSFLFTGCITMCTLDRAKDDRMPERVKKVLTSYKDSSGNTVVVYKKRYHRSLYKAVVPLDSILDKYKQSEKEDLLNRDSTCENFVGVFTEKTGNKKDTQRIVLFNNETPLADTTGLHKEIAKNEQVVEEHKGKTLIPSKYSITVENKKTRAVCFVVKTGNMGDSNNAKNVKYYLAFQPQKHNRVRYLLVPLTVGIDAVSWPVQLIIGFIALSKVPIS